MPVLDGNGRENRAGEVVAGTYRLAKGKVLWSHVEPETKL
jgi:hypothetical protein